MPYAVSKLPRIALEKKAEGMDCLPNANEFVNDSSIWAAAKVKSGALSLNSVRHPWVGPPRVSRQTCARFDSGRHLI